MALLDEKVQEQLKGVFSKLKNKVNLVYFTQETLCPSCKDTGDFLDEITGLSDKLVLTVYDFEKDLDKVEELRVNKIPAIVLLDEQGKDSGITYYGIPAGYEINSFVMTLIEVSGEKEELPDDIVSRISKINKDIHIQVFVSLTCPKCPDAVMLAHRLALENDSIRSDMIESSIFNHLTVRYDVSAVPKIIINEETELLGAQPINVFLDAIEKV